MDFNYNPHLKYQVFYCKMGGRSNDKAYEFTLTKNRFLLNENLHKHLSASNTVYFADNKDLGYILISTVPFTEEFIEASVDNDGVSAVSNETIQALRKLFNVEGDEMVFERIAVPTKEKLNFAGILI